MRQKIGLKSKDTDESVIANLEEYNSKKTQSMTGSAKFVEHSPPGLNAIFAYAINLENDNDIVKDLIVAYMCAHVLRRWYKHLHL